MSDVNMLTSLKALLFSSAATRVPADGAGALAVPGDGAVDFAQLLKGKAEASPAAVAAEPPVAPEAVELAGTADPAKGETLPVEASNVLPFGLATALNAVEGHRKASLPLPPGLAQRVEKAQTASAEDTEDAALPPPSAGAEAVEPAAEKPADLPVPMPVDPVEGEPLVAEQPVVQHDKPAKAVRAAEKPEIAKAEPSLEAPAVEQAAGEAAAGQDEGEPAPASTDAAPLPLPMPAPIVTIAPQALPAKPVKVSEAPRLSVAASQPAPLPVPIRQDAEVMPEAQPAVTAAPLDKPASEKPAPERPVPDKKVARDMPLADMPAAGAQIAPQVPEQSRPASPMVARAPAGNAAATTDEQPVIADQTLALAPAAQAQPVKSEALALLQMVRDQVAARQPGAPVRAGEQVSAVARTRPERSAKAAEAASASPAQPVPADAAPQAVPSQPSAATVAPSAVAAAPVADLSASLGAHVVDMGVSGQWIDGLARDIAGLSANGAQGRFQINADHLGQVQVDIRQGQDGAAVSLTVASAAAETALRQDSDRLRLDAGLAAVRITDVKIERAPHVAEAARADSANQQGSQQQPQQQSSQQQSAQTGWANSQNMGQPQGQGRWRPQENSGFTSKNSSDPDVLNHDGMRRAGNDTTRARYA